MKNVNTKPCLNSKRCVPKVITQQKEQENYIAKTLSKFQTYSIEKIKTFLIDSFDPFFFKNNAVIFFFRRVIIIIK